MNVKGIKIKKVSIALFVLALACLAGLLPPVREAAIAVAASILAKGLRNMDAEKLIKMNLYLTHWSATGLTMFALLGFLLSAGDKSDFVPEGFEKIKANKRIIVALFAVYIVALYPLFRANFNYNDDTQRVLEGNPFWDHFSRYVSTFLSFFVDMNLLLIDSSPLTQLLAICFMVCASVTVILAVRQINQETELSLWDMVALIPLGLCPYFLQCISYKFDSPHMALSVLVSVLPLLFRGRKTALYCGISVFCLLIMCMTYQASAGIFPMFVLLLAFLMWHKGEDVKQIGVFVGKSVLSYIIAVGWFYLFLMIPAAKVPGAYYSESIASFGVIVSHYKMFIALLASYFKLLWLLLIAALSIWFVASSVLESKRNKAASFVLSAVVVWLMFLLSFGVYPAMESPTKDPRSMYGVGVFIALVGIGNVAILRGKWLTRGLTLVLSWAFLAFACIYGNALAYQNEYTNFRISEALYDLTDLDEFNTQDDKFVQVVGNAGHSPLVLAMARNSNAPILKRMVSVMFGKGIHPQMKFSEYFGLNAYWTRNPANFDYQDWDLLHESHYHKIYYSENRFVVELTAPQNADTRKLQRNYTPR